MPLSDKDIFRGFLDFSMSDWDKRMCAVLFTGGCNFRCPYCHNRDLVFNTGKLSGFSFEDVKPLIMKHKLWVDNVTISGGEPTLHGDKLMDVIIDLKASGFNVRLDTNGSNPGFLHSALGKGYLDCVAMDVKGPVGQGRYGLYAGVDAAGYEDRIIDSISCIIGSGVEHEFRTTIVPGLHTESDVNEIHSMLSSMGTLSYHLQNFRSADTLLDPSYIDKRSFSQEYFSLLKTKYEIVRDRGNEHFNNSPALESQQTVGPGHTLS